MIVAIDGPAAAGKGTLARALAARFGFAHLDTGMLYRAVGAKTLRAGGDPADPAAATDAALALVEADLAAPGLRTAEIGQAGSIVSAIPSVRAALLDWQRRFAARPEGAVLDGRDVGTVVCPQAEVKLFLTADVEERARRRRDELAAGGDVRAFAEILADLKLRDARDANRAVAPLKPAADAHVIDTTRFGALDAFATACDLVEAALATARPKPAS